MMLLITHIVIALASLVSTTLAYVSPSHRKFNLNYGLIGLTFISGTALVIVTHAALLPACEAGLTYLSVVTVGSLLAHRRYAREQICTNTVDKNL